MAVYFNQVSCSRCSFTSESRKDTVYMIFDPHYQTAFAQSYRKLKREGLAKFVLCMPCYNLISNNSEEFNKYLDKLSDQNLLRKHLQ